MTQVTAQLSHLHIAPRKVRLLAHAIKGLSVQEAEAQLMFRPQRSKEPILKLLRSAVANAKNNHKLNPDTLIVASIRVDQGPTMKRFLPRAMGRATPIHKKTSHVTIALEEKKDAARPRFTIATTKKIKGATKKKKKVQKPAPKAAEASREAVPKQPKEKAGFLKRLFRRSKNV